MNTDIEAKRTYCYGTGRTRSTNGGKSIKIGFLVPEEIWTLCSAPIAGSHGA